jgi:hypothetical protein
MPMPQSTPWAGEYFARIGQAPPINLSIKAKFLLKTHFFLSAVVHAVQLHQSKMSRCSNEKEVIEQMLE